MKNLFLFCCVVISVSGFTQNLVPNPSFEEYEECPQLISEMNALDWWSPTFSTPDYFNTCSPPEVGIPQNVFGVQEAQEGNAYAGCWLSDFMEFSEYREYIQCSLLEPLVENESYQVSYFLSRSDSSTKACDNFGCLFTFDELNLETVNNLDYTPQVLSAPGVPITANDSWVQIVDTIIANGGEEYLTLGVFSNNENTTWIDVEGGWQDEAYYYIDNVSVISLNDLNVSYHPDETWVVFPNPAYDLLKVDAKTQGFNVVLYSLQGKLIFKKQELTTTFELDISGISPGSYILSLSNTSELFTSIIYIK